MSSIIPLFSPSTLTHSHTYTYFFPRGSTTGVCERSPGGAIMDGGRREECVCLSHGFSFSTLLLAEHPLSSCFLLYYYTLPLFFLSSLPSLHRLLSDRDEGLCFLPLSPPSVSFWPTQTVSFPHPRWIWRWEKRHQARLTANHWSGIDTPTHCQSYYASLCVCERERMNSDITAEDDQ